MENHHSCCVDFPAHLHLVSAEVEQVMQII